MTSLGGNELGIGPKVIVLPMRRAEACVEIIDAVRTYVYRKMVGNQLGQEPLIHGPTTFYEVLVCRLCRHADFLYLTDMVEQ
jgi:hypothetical protein